MRITLIGHAAILVEMRDAICLMDPVFNDPCGEGTVVSCPRRKVYLDRMPKPDILIISHRHPSHFDIPSLAQVPRDCDAICPADPLIIYTLKRLGFARVHSAYPMAPITSTEFKLYPTRSEVRGAREFGMIFRDRTGTFWNQVDTLLSPDTIRRVRERFGRIDLLFARYSSQNFEFFNGRPTTFPFEDHQRNLENVLRIYPRMVAPGSAGFRFWGDHAWLNAFLFPVSRERFVRDLKRLDPNLSTQILNPGDVVEIDGKAVRYLAGASDFAVMEEDDTYQFRFDPTTPIPGLIDPNPDSYPQAHLIEVVQHFIGEGMVQYVREGYAKSDPVINRYREHQVRYGIAVVFPDGEVIEYRFNFGDTVPRLITGAVQADAADMMHRIAASALVSWIETKKSFFYVRAYSRRFTTLYKLIRERDNVQAKPVLLPDLLMQYLLHAAGGLEFAAKRQIDLQLKAVKSLV